MFPPDFTALLFHLCVSCFFRFTEKGNLEVLLFTIQSKMRANNQKVYMPREGKLISDINKVRFSSSAAQTKNVFLSVQKHKLQTSFDLSHWWYNTAEADMWTNWPDDRMSRFGSRRLWYLMLFVLSGLGATGEGRAWEGAGSEDGADSSGETGTVGQTLRPQGGHERDLAQRKPETGVTGQ